MELFKVLITSVCLIITGNFVTSSSGDCNIAKNVLNQLKSNIGEKIGEDPKTETDCEELLLKAINFSSRLRNELKKKAADNRQIYNETELKLQNEQKELVSALVPIETKKKQNYVNILISARNQTQYISQSIENAIKEQSALIIELNFYLSQINFTDYDEATCSLTNERGDLVISILNEIHLALMGERSLDTCEKLIETMMSIDALINLSVKMNEQKLKLLNKTYDERKRVAKKIVEHAESQRTDYESLNDDFESFNGQVKVVQQKSQTLAMNVSEKSFEFIVKMIKNGRNFYAAKIALDDANENAFFNALNQSYSCDSKHLENVILFADYNGLKSGYEKTFELMKECGHLRNPMILKLAYEIKNQNLSEHVDLVYKDLVQKISNNKADEVVKIFAKFNRDLVDYSKIIQMSYDKNVKNFEILTNFIDKVDLPNKMLETELYDEMMNSSHVDTVEHVMFGFWLKKKFHQDNQESWQPHESNIYKQSLEKLKERLPDGIRFLFFEPSVVFAMPNYTYLIRAFGHDSVKFNAIPANDGRYFRLEDTKDNVALYWTNMKGKSIVMVGIGELRSYYWQIIPTENAKYFLLKNAESGMFLSSEEYRNCVEWKTHWFSKDECIQMEYFNKASNESERDLNPTTHKWMITTFIIRDNILKDRTNKKIYKD